MIDVTFRFTSDTPEGKDPDSHSPTLRRYHRLLWSKQLPNGRFFELSDTTSGVYLHHRSELGEFRLSSDGISHTYKYVKRMSHIIGQVPKDDVEEFYSLASTIAGYIVFPSNQIDKKVTINAARGMSRQIGDRFDLTLECIRRYYENLPSPLSVILERYSYYFDLFGDFEGYVDFFLLQDHISNGAM